MRQKQLRVEIGRRMELAARSVGMGFAAIAEKIGRRPPTVYRWWKGQQSPSDVDMGRYAEIVGVSVDYLLYGFRGTAATCEDEIRRLVAGLVFHGMDPTEALEAATEGAGGEAAAPTAEERAELQASAHSMREVLWEHSGGHWDELTPGQRSAVLNLIEEIARGNRAGPANSHSAPNDE